MEPVPEMPERYIQAALAAPHGQERAAVIREAWSWLGTPWRHECRAKRTPEGGGGVDCGNIVAGVFVNAKMIEAPPLYKYPVDFYLHSEQEIFRDIVSKFCFQTVNRTPFAADILAVRVGKLSIGHLAIVICWPIVIHASRPDKGVVLAEGNAGSLMTHRSGFWRLNKWE